MPSYGITSEHALSVARERWIQTATAEARAAKARALAAIEIVVAYPITVDGAKRFLEAEAAKGAALQRATEALDLAEREVPALPLDPRHARGPVRRRSRTPTDHPLTLA